MSSSTGISLKTQELTALFLAVRLYCSFVMEFDLHTLLDSATLATTLWVIYMIRFNLRPTYMEDKDNFAIYYVVCYTTKLVLGFLCFDSMHETDFVVITQVTHRYLERASSSHLKLV